MTEQEFIKLLRTARNQAYDFAKNYVTNHLEEKFNYDIQLNQSHDEPRLEKFDHYPQDDEKSYENLNETEIIKLLLRNGKVPVWIDINVKTVRNNTVILNLYCAGRYSNNKSEFYYEKRGTGPFGIKSPYLPFDYQEGNKFKI